MPQFNNQGIDPEIIELLKALISGSQGVAPKVVDMGATPPPINVPVQDSQRLGQMLANQPSVDTSVNPLLKDLGSAILQKGIGNALQGKRDQAALDQAVKPFVPNTPDIENLKRFQGTNLTRF